MAKLKASTFDPFGVDQAVTTAPAGQVAAAIPAPAPVPVPAAAPAPVEHEPGEQAPVPPLFVRISANDDDWLREVRYRQRVPSSALVRALIRLAGEDEQLLDQALQRARQDMTTERPGPRRRS